MEPVRTYVLFMNEAVRLARLRQRLSRFGWSRWGDLEPHINQDKIVYQTAQILAVPPDDPKPPNQDELDPGKAQAAYISKTETRATHQAPARSIS